MSRIIRILLVEDVEDDAVLIQHVLKRNGVQFEMTRVEDPDEMMAALDEHEWDLVLSDYNLPRFSGLAALELVRQHDVDIPFIIVSGAIGEETAVAVMRAGAQDYILKGNLTRLAPAVQREVAEVKLRQERTQVQQELKESERRFQTLVSDSPVGIYRTDAKGNCLYVNPRWCELAGVQAEIALRRGWTTSLHPEDSPVIERAWNRALNSGTSFEAEYRFAHGPDQVTWVYGQAVVEHNDNGEVTGYIGTITDISERKIAQQALIDTEARLSTFVDGVGDMVYHRGLDGSFSMINNACQSITGYSQNEFSRNANLFESLVHVDDRQIMDVATDNSDDTFREQEYRLTARGGNQLSINSRRFAVRNSAGEITGFYFIDRDITRQKLVDKRLTDSEELHRNLIEMMSEGLCSADEDCCPTFVNDAFCDLLGYSREELIGHSLLEFLDEENGKILKTQMERRQSGHHDTYELTWTRKDGEEQSTLVSAVPLTDENQYLHGSLAVITNITRRKQVEELVAKSAHELKDEQEKLAEKNAALNQVLQHLEQEKDSYKHDLCLGLERALLPYIEKLKDNDGHIGRKDLGELEDHLKSIVKKDIDDFRGNFSRLTSRESEVCNLISLGMTSKQISDELSLSTLTVHKHREVIRRKLKLQNRNVNLGAFLRSK